LCAPARRVRALQRDATNVVARYKKQARASEERLYRIVVGLAHGRGARSAGA
jgi:hypothetical protein